MKSFLQYLQEEKQIGILYHYTSIPKLISIIKSNSLKSGKYETYLPLQNKYVNSISLTRDKNFHRLWRLGIITECRFIVDGNKLSRKYRIRPYHYFKNYHYNETHKDEQEEIVLTQEITNLSDYVIKLQILRLPDFDEIEENGGWVEPFDNIEDVKNFINSYSPFDVEWLIN